MEQAYVTGLSLATNAISACDPGIGLVNVVELPPHSTQTVPTSPVSRTLQQPPLPSPLGGRVYGVVYQFPRCKEMELWETIGNLGSYCVLGRFKAHLLGEGMNRRDVEVVVPAAFDVEYHQEQHTDRLADGTWTPMPPRMELERQKHDNMLLGKSVVSTGTQRWPGSFWCNWPCSHLVRPTDQHLAQIRVVFQSQVASKVEVPAEYYAAYESIYGKPGETVPPAMFTPFASPTPVKAWYFAYGSNLSWEQVCIRIGPPYERRAVRLDNYELIANKPCPSPQYKSFGYFNVAPVNEERKREIDEKRSTDPLAAMPSFVSGAAYLITKQQLERMDQFERGYRRELHACQGDDGNTIDCWVYIALETAENLLPSKEYLGRVLEGRDIVPVEYGLAIQRLPQNPLPSPRREMRLKREL